MPSSTDAPPDQLAFTGVNVATALALAVVLVLVGAFTHIARKGARREH